MEQSECESVRVEQEGRDDDGDGTNEHEDDAKKVKIARISSDTQ